MYTECTEHNFESAFMLLMLRGRRAECRYRKLWDTANGFDILFYLKWSLLIFLFIDSDAVKYLYAYRTNRVHPSTSLML